MGTGLTGIIIAEPGRMRECFHAMLTSIPQIDQVHLVDQPAQTMSLIESENINFVLVEANVVDDELEKLFVELKVMSPDTKSLAITENSAQQTQLRSAGADEVIVRGASAAAFIESLCRVVPIESLRERVSMCTDEHSETETPAAL